MTAIDQCKTFGEFASLVSLECTPTSSKVAYAKQGCLTKYVVLSNQQTLSLDSLFSKFKLLVQKQTTITPSDIEQRAAAIKNLTALYVQANTTANCFFRIINAIINLIKALFCCKTKDQMAEILETERNRLSPSTPSLPVPLTPTPPVAIVEPTPREPVPSSTTLITPAPNSAPTPREPVIPTPSPIPISPATSVAKPAPITGDLLAKNCPIHMTAMSVNLSKMFNALATEIENLIAKYPARIDELRSKLTTPRICFYGNQGARTYWPAITTFVESAFQTTNGKAEPAPMLGMICIDANPNYASVLTPEDFPYPTIAHHYALIGYNVNAQANIENIKKAAEFLVSNIIDAAPAASTPVNIPIPDPAVLLPKPPLVSKTITGKVLMDLCPIHPSASHIATESLFDALATNLEKLINTYPVDQRDLLRNRVSTTMVGFYLGNIRNDWSAIQKFVEDEIQKKMTFGKAGPILVLTINHRGQYLAMTPPAEFPYTVIQLWGTQSNGYDADARINNRNMEKLAIAMLDNAKIMLEAPTAPLATTTPVPVTVPSTLISPSIPIQGATEPATTGKVVVPKPITGQFLFDTCLRHRTVSYIGMSMYDALAKELEKLIKASPNEELRGKLGKACFYGVSGTRLDWAALEAFAENNGMTKMGINKKSSVIVLILLGVSSDESIPVKVPRSFSYNTMTLFANHDDFDQSNPANNTNMVKLAHMMLEL